MKRDSARVLCIVLAMLILGLCFSACGGKESNAPEINNPSAVTEEEDSETESPEEQSSTPQPVSTAAAEPTKEPVTVAIKYDNKEAAELSFMTASVFQLKADSSDGSGGGVWTSSDAGIASVDENGIVTCWKAGTAKITYTLGDASAVCTLKVDEPTVKILFGDTEKNDISLSGQWGYEIQLTAVVSPAETDVTWSSEDPAVATVSETGYVTALRGGNTVISCACGTAKAECIIRVLGTPPAQAEETAKATPDPNDKTPRVVITYAGAANTDFTIPVGTSVDMNYDLYNIDPNAAVTWSIADTAIATVNDAGVVTGVKKGTTKLICTCGENKCECIVRISDVQG